MPTHDIIDNRNEKIDRKIGNQETEIEIFLNKVFARFNFLRTLTGFSEQENFERRQ